MTKRRRGNSPIVVIGDVALVELSSGKSAIIDVEDVELVSQYNWHYNGGYAKTGSHYYKENGKQSCRMLFMHKLIMRAESMVDHINGDCLDNRKSNLRCATRQQNAFNSRVHRDSLSGLKGASYSKPKRKWSSRIVKDGKDIHLGYYPTREEAHAQYCAHAKMLFGEFARTS